MEEEVESEETVFADPHGLDVVSEEEFADPSGLDVVSEIEDLLKAAQKLKPGGKQVTLSPEFLDSLKTLRAEVDKARESEDETVEEEVEVEVEVQDGDDENTESLRSILPRRPPAQLGEIHEIDIFGGGGLAELTKRFAKELLERPTTPKEERRDRRNDKKNVRNIKRHLRKDEREEKKADRKERRGGKAGDESKTRKGEEDYSAKKEKKGDDKRKGAEKDGAEGTLAETPGHGRVDY